MKRIMFLATIVLITLSFSVCATAWTGIYSARVAGDKDATIDLNSWFTGQGALGSSSGTNTAAGAPDCYGLYTSSYFSVVGLRSGTYANALPTTGYYEAFTSWGTTTSAKTNAHHVVTSAGGATSDYYLNQLASSDYWASLGVHKYNANDAANTKIMLTNDNQSTSGSLYHHSAKYESVTPGAAIYGGPANGATGTVDDFMELSWTAGDYTSFFDVYFGTTSGSLGLLAGDLTPDMLACDLVGSLAAGTQYFWRVDAKNVELVTQGAEWSFTTDLVGGVPEPGSMLALGSGLIGLFGIMRRKRA